MPITQVLEKQSLGWPGLYIQQDHFKKPEQICRISRGFHLSPGSIRLPKAAKTPLKIHPPVRLPLATIVKDLGMGWKPHLIQGGLKVEKQFGWCQAASRFTIQEPFLPLSFPFPLSPNCVCVCVCILFFPFWWWCFRSKPRTHILGKCFTIEAHFWHSSDFS